MKDMPGPSYKVIGSVRSLRAADVRSGAVVSVVKSARQGEFTENAAIICGRKRLVGTRMEAHLAVSAKREGTTHCFVGDDIYPYRK